MNEILANPNSHPISFCENNFNYKLYGTGYKPFCDVYNYIGVKALEKDSKPVIMVKGRQAGATTTALGIETYFMCSGLFGNAITPPIRLLHAFPLLETARAYSKNHLNNNLMKDLMKDCLNPRTIDQNSLSFKNFIGGNELWIDSTGLDSSRLRGRAFDAIFFDEVQEMHDLALENAKINLLYAKHGKPGQGIQFYFGTPKSKDSYFHEMWKKSSQQYYHLGCGSCNQYFQLYTPGTDDWENVWLDDFIVKCTNCGYEQDKRLAAENGKWVCSQDINDPSCEYVGFHLNQLYMPDFPKEKILAEKPGPHPFNTENSYQNEVLAEFF